MISCSNKEVIFEDMRYLICKNPQKQENDRAFRDNLIKLVSPKLKAIIQKARCAIKTKEGG